MTAPTDDLITMTEVTRLMGGVYDSTVRRWIRKGIFPKPVKIGQAVSRWRRADVLAAREKMIEENAK